MKEILKALFDPSAWVLILMGGLLLGARIPLPSDLFVNLPELITIFQLCGGLFLLCAFCIFASRIIWPQINVALLLKEQTPHAYIVIVGLLIFNGLMIIAFSVWLTGVFQGAMAVPK